MLVLGIDPGVALTGYGLVAQSDGGELQMLDFGVIRTGAELDLSSRLKIIYQSLNDLLLLHQPDSAAVEKLFFQRNVTTAISVGEARGVCLLALAQHHIPTAEYSPLEVKKAITGYGAAEKRQVQSMVQVILHLPQMPKPDDAADALGIAVCHIHHWGYMQAVS